MKALLVGVLATRMGCTPPTETADAQASDSKPADAAMPDAGPVHTVVDPATATELVIAGAPTTNAGMSDVAVLYPNAAASGVLTFTAVNVSAAGAALQTRIASSPDHGATWTYIADVNTPTPISITCPTGVCQGKAIDEVSTVIEDPTDVAARRWKVLTHRYFVQTGSPNPQYNYGYIAVYTAASPAGPWSAAQNLIGWPSTSGFSTNGAIMTTATAGIASCIYLTEPSAIVVDSATYVAVGCVRSATEISIEFLKSTDHLASLAYVSTVATTADSLLLGGSAARVNAAHLFSVAGTVHASVSPGNANGNYLGCSIVQLDSSGATVRAGTAPVVSRVFDAPNTPQRGACSFSEGATALGYVMNIPNAQPLRFRVFRTGVMTP